MQVNKNPNVQVNISGTALPNYDYTKNLCIIGHKTSAGIANANQVYDVNSIYNAEIMFGANSQLTNAIRKYKEINTSFVLKAIGLTDLSGGTKSTLARTLSGAATENGTLTYKVGGKNYSIAIVNGDTAADVATAIASAINADTKALVTASVSTATITLSYIHKGTFRIDDEIISVSSTNTSLEIAGLTIGSATFTAGTGLADLSNVITAISAVDCNFVIPVEYLADATSQALIVAEIERRKQINNEELNGFLFTTFTGSYSAVTATTLDTLQNNPNLDRVAILVKNVSTNANYTSSSTDDGLAISAIFASNEQKLISDFVDTTSITPNQTLGNKNRVCAARGGMILENISISGQANETSFEDTEVDALRLKGITALRIENSSLVTDEVYTTANPNNNNAMFRQYPVALVAAIIQSDIYSTAKTILQGKVLDNTVIDQIRTAIINKIVVYSSIDYKWLQEDKKNATVNSLSVTSELRTINGITKKVAVISCKLYANSPLEDVFFNVSYAII